MGDKGREVKKNLKKWVTSFMDGPWAIIPRTPPLYYKTMTNYFACRIAIFDIRERKKEENRHCQSTFIDILHCME